MEATVQGCHVAAHSAELRPSGGARPRREARRGTRARARAPPDIRRGRGRFSLLGGPLEHGPALELVARESLDSPRPPPRRRAAPARPRR